MVTQSKDKSHETDDQEEPGKRSGEQPEAQKPMKREVSNFWILALLSLLAIYACRVLNLPLSARSDFLSSLFFIALHQKWTFVTVSRVIT